jgi:hypothetical protein
MDLFSWIRFRFLIFFFTGVALSTSFSQYCDVPYFSQEQNYWCWAAVDKMIYSYRGATGIQQCDDANLVPPSFACGIPTTGTCCTNPSSCDLPCLPHPQSYYSTSIRYGTLTWTEVKAALKTGSCSPFIFIYTYNLGGNHFRLARGYIDSFAGKLIRISDPSPLFADSTYMFYNDYKAHSSIVWYNIH